MLTEYHTHEMATASERSIRNALKFGQSGEVDSKEGRAQAEGLEFAPPNCSEVGIPQVELNGAIGEALIANPVPQRPRTNLIFDVRIKNDFWTDRTANPVALSADITDIACGCV